MCMFSFNHIENISIIINCNYVSYINFHRHKSYSPYWQTIPIHTCVLPFTTSNILRLFIWTLRSSSSTALSKSSWVVNGITNYTKRNTRNHAATNSFQDHLIPTGLQLRAPRISASLICHYNGIPNEYMYPDFALPILPPLKSQNKL